MLKVNEQVQFFPNKQGTGSLTWMTGTVTEILDCGCSYMIQGPNGRVYRRNRAHLKPICYDSTSFQDHSVKREEKQPESNSFQDPKPTKVKNMSFQMDTIYMDARSMLFDEPDTHLHHHPGDYTHPGHHHIYPLHLYHQGNHQLNPAQRTPHLQVGWDTSLNQPSSDPCDIDRGLISRLSALLQETSPLAPYKLERSTKARTGFQHNALNSFQDPLEENWCILTHFKTLTHRAKFDSFQDHHSSLYGISSEIDSFQDPCELQSNWLISGPRVCMWHRTPSILTLFMTPVNYHQIDSFQDPIFICSTKTVQIDSFQDPYIGLHSVFTLHRRNSSNWQC